jgi:hypothetical protein
LHNEIDNNNLGHANSVILQDQREEASWGMLPASMPGWRIDGACNDASDLLCSSIILEAAAAGT